MSSGRTTLLMRVVMWSSLALFAGTWLFAAWLSFEVWRMLIDFLVSVAGGK